MKLTQNLWGDPAVRGQTGHGNFTNKDWRSQLSPQGNKSIQSQVKRHFGLNSKRTVSKWLQGIDSGAMNRWGFVIDIRCCKTTII